MGCVRIWLKKEFGVKNMRQDMRAADELRPISIQTGFINHARGSALICWGNTRVICTASWQEQAPAFCQGQGWLTAEYNMLPASTGQRKARGQDGRAKEIQRLIGRSLRAALDMTRLTGQITIDCDVIDADGGTRTASITGGYVALALCVKSLLQEGVLQENPIVQQIAAVSVGIVNDIPCLDLPYGEDSIAQVDMNVIMAPGGGIVEVQGTGEGRTFTRKEHDQLLDLADAGLQRVFALQQDALRR